MADSNVKIYIFGKEYEVPESLTIMNAMDNLPHQRRQSSSHSSCLPDES